MDGQAIITVSATVVTLVSLVKWAGVPDRKAPIAVIACSVFGVLFWGWAEGSLARATAFEYFAGFVAVMTSAAGVFGFTRATSEGLAKMRGPSNDGGV